VVLLIEKLIGARSTFLDRFLAIALEHQGRGPPDVDFGYHGPQGYRLSGSDPEERRYQGVRTVDVSDSFLRDRQHSTTT
jgi:hypothetical protein